MGEYKITIQRFLDYYKKFFSGNKSLTVIEKCEIFIKNYFDNLYKKICDENVETILSLSERDTKIVRTRFGVYDDGDCQTYKTISERFNLKSPNSIIDKFNRKIFDDLDKKVLAYSILIECPNDQVIDILQVYLGEKVINILKNGGIITIQDLLCLTQEEVILIKNMDMIMGNNIINVMHSLGYKFADEKDNDNDESHEDFLLNSERLLVVRTLLAKKNEWFECQKELSEINNQIALLTNEKHSKEKESSVLILEIKRLESQLQSNENQLKK